MQRASQNTHGTRLSRKRTTEDAHGKFTYKTGYKAGDSNASGTYGICKRASSTCDKPTVFKNTAGSTTKSKTTKTT